MTTLLVAIITLAVEYALWTRHQTTQRMDHWVGRR